VSSPGSSAPTTRRTSAAIRAREPASGHRTPPLLVVAEALVKAPTILPFIAASPRRRTTERILSYLSLQMRVAGRSISDQRTTRPLARRPLLLLLTLIAVSGMCLRLIPLLIRGPIAQGFDSGVYYSASGSWVAGYRPYVDFGFFHPPGVLIALLPITWLGTHVVGHAEAFGLAGTLSGLLAGVTIFTIGLLGNRWRGPVAAIVAALFYATFLPAIRAEAMIRLEPYVSLALVLTAAVWLTGPPPKPSYRRSAAAAATAAIATMMKFTGGVALIACLASRPFPRRFIDRAVMCALAAGFAFLLLAPFVADGGFRSFLDMAVATQWSRPGADIRGGDVTDPAARLVHMLQVGPLGLVWAQLPRLALLPMLVAWLGLAGWSFLRGGEHGRFWSVTWLASLVLVLPARSYYDNYPVPMAVAGAMLLGAAAAECAAALKVRPRVVTSALVLVALMLLTPAAYDLRAKLRQPSYDPASAIRETVPVDACLYADPPSFAIAAGRLPPAKARDPLVDPFGELVYIALQQGVAYAAAQDAVYSDKAQERVRLAIEACPYVALRGPGFLQPRISPATARWLADNYELVVDPQREDRVYLWRRR
jgi:hypothetical protein